jgi:hypothetical protein
MNRREALNRVMSVAGGTAFCSFAGKSTASILQSRPGKVQSNMPTIAPPDPNTRTPRYKMPEGACDSHCHIFGPASKYPHAPDRTYTPPDAPLELFRALHAKIGVQRAVIVNASAHGLDNRAAVDAIAVSNGRYRGVANIDDRISRKSHTEAQRRRESFSLCLCASVVIIYLALVLSKYSMMTSRAVGCTISQCAEGILRITISLASIFTSATPFNSRSSFTSSLSAGAGF